MSRNHMAGVMALALAALLAAGAALWLGTRPVMPLPAPGPMQPELEAALAQLDRAQSGEAQALPALRARLLALAELQDRAGEPLRTEALLQGLAGRIEGTLATIEGPARAASPAGVLPLAALCVGALGLLALLLSRRRAAPAPVPGDTAPAWSEALREEVQAALAAARQAQEEAARAATRAHDQQERLAQRLRLVAERLDAMPAGGGDARLPALLDRIETLAAGLGQAASRAEAAQERQSRGLERLEGAVDNLHAIPTPSDGADPGLAALLPAFEAAAAECRATAPLLGELAALAQQAMARVTEEAVTRIGAAGDHAVGAGHAAREESRAALAEAGRRLDQLAAGLPIAELKGQVDRIAAAAAEVARVGQGLGSGLPVADLALQVDRVTAAAAHVERAAQGLEGGLPVLELTAQIARLDAAAGAVEQAAGRIPVTDLADQVDRFSSQVAAQLAQVTEGVATLAEGAQRVARALPVEALGAQVARVEAVATALAEGAQRLEAARATDTPQAEAMRGAA